jgi:hypothetical protein
VSRGELCVKSGAQCQEHDSASRAVLSVKSRAQCQERGSVSGAELSVSLAVSGLQPGLQRSNYRAESHASLPALVNELAAVWQGGADEAGNPSGLPISSGA